MKKTFVLDTNVLLHNAECIEVFADNIVVIPMAVIEELDKFKGHNDELGRNARRVIRRLDKLRSKGSLRDGAPLTGGGMLKILSSRAIIAETGLTGDIPDNRILALAYALFKKGEKVIFVSKDINARLKADALGLKAVDFEREKINIDELYSGYSHSTVPSPVMDELLAKGTIAMNGTRRYPNEFVVLKDQSDAKRTAITRVGKPGFVKLVPQDGRMVWNVKPRNREQCMALELLMDNNVQVVTLVGRAGTGKTLLALAAALQCVMRDHKYDRILVSRPIIPMGQDIGYLPGSKDEKLANWMQPIFDNLGYLLRDGATDIDAGKKKGKSNVLDRIDRLLADKTIGLEALTYIRGRSIPDQFVIVDEAQNLTPHEVKTIISRAGEGTKMVLTGDPYQIDNPYLDSSSNGLTYTAERLKGESIHGHVTLTTSERSTLAAIAAEKL